MDYFYLKPGNIAIATKTCLIETIVGSCVSVILYASNRQIGGMNHYVMPEVLQNREATPYFGRPAVTLLLAAFQRLQVKPSEIRATLIGGAHMKAMDSKVGMMNSQLARDMLTEAGIRVIKEDSGGIYGRVILFNSNTGVIELRKAGSKPSRNRSNHSSYSSKLERLQISSKNGIYLIGN